MTSSRRLFTLATVLFAAGTLAITGCSSSTSSEEGDSTSTASAPSTSEATAASPAATESATDSATTDAAEAFTLDQVAQHNTSGDCWTAIDGNVYDLSDWEDQHPGGAARIRSLCGIDGTSLFNAQHEGQSRPEGTLDGYQIGVLAQG
jgi:cytochrome b involved in lipid metabolism